MLYVREPRTQVRVSRRTLLEMKSVDSMSLPEQADNLTSSNKVLQSDPQLNTLDAESTGN